MNGALIAFFVIGILLVLYCLWNAIAAARREWTPQEPADKPARPKCHNCGKLNQRARYCPRCGEPQKPEHLVSRADLEAQFGAMNIACWADKDNDGDPAKIEANIEYARKMADRRITLRAAQLRAPLPDSASVLYSGLQDYASIYAGTMLYRFRGDPTESDDGTFAQMLQDSEERLEMALVAGRKC